VGSADIEDDGEAFEDKMMRLTGLLKQQQEEGAKLDQQIAENLRRLGYE
jgi:type I restriction enzyme M protein